MRVNVYAEEMTDRVEVISKEIDGRTFTGLRLYLELPCTVPWPKPGTGENGGSATTKPRNVSGPFIHHPGDDDSAAVTFWGKRDLRHVLRKMITALDDHYAPKSVPTGPYVTCSYCQKRIPVTSSSMAASALHQEDCEAYQRAQR